MKKQIRQFSKFMAWIMASVLIPGILANTPALAQTEPANVKKSFEWLVTYTVTVDADFTKEPELGSGDPTIVYKIKRKYWGIAEMTFIPGTSLANGGSMRPTFFDKDPKLFIDIDDSKITTHDPLCEEWMKIEEAWKAGIKQTGNVSQIFIDNGKIYSVNLQLESRTKADFKNKELKYTKKVTQNKRSGQQNVLTDQTDDLRMDNFQLPNVAGFIKNGAISPSENNLELKPNAKLVGYFDWFSNELHPDGPVLGVPKDEIKIRIKLIIIKKVKE